MKLKKKTAMLLSIAVGSTLFVTTAMAEVTSKSGYEQLKDSLKFTTASVSEKLSSFTVETSYVVKDNDKVLDSDNKLNLYDVINKAMFNTGTTTDRYGNTSKNLYYSDKDTNITYNSYDDSYYVYNYPQGYNMGTVFNDPFKERQAGDIEKIIDALVGNLKDYVIVSDNADGSKDMTGSLSAAQIPALVNALVSFEFKQIYNVPMARFVSSNGMAVNEDYSNAVQGISKDVFVKEVNGKMHVNKDGLVESFFAACTVSGKDDKDVEHNLTVELLMKLRDFNSTVVTKPDLTGKKVISPEVMKDGPAPIDTIDAKKYAGTYKNDIIIEKDGQFVKIGERVLDITQVDGKTIAGRYHEEIKEDYPDYSSKKRDYTFTGSSNSPQGYGLNYEIKSTEGNIMSISLNPNARIFAGWKIANGNDINATAFAEEFAKVFSEK